MKKKIREICVFPCPGNLVAVGGRAVKGILEKWPIGPVAVIEPTPVGGSTSFVTPVDGDCFVLKERVDLARVQRECALLPELAKAGIPVPIPISTVDGDSYAVGGEGQTFRLYPRLPGKVVTEHYGGDAEKRAGAFGRAIGFLHERLRACDGLDDFRDMDLVGQIRGWAIPRIRAGKAVVDAEAIERIWRDVEGEFVPLHDDLPKQLIHRDAHPYNMLFDEGKLTGLLDFEMVVRGLPLFDVCYCASAILVDGFEASEKAQKWPALFRSLVAGYEAFRPLSSAERLAVYGVLVAIEFLFIAFWLGRCDEDNAGSIERLLYWLSANRKVLEI
jgi:Ser/Thr protein kinase RdoA (MazF antagonist)